MPPDNAIRAVAASKVVAKAVLAEASPAEKELPEVALPDAALEEPALAESVELEVAVREAVPRDIRGCLVAFACPFLGAPFLPADFGRFSATRTHGSGIFFLFVSTLRTVASSIHALRLQGNVHKPLQTYTLGRDI